MNKSEHKAWVRRMRALNKKSRDDARDWYARFGGSYNRNRNITDYSYGSMPFIAFDEMSVVRNLKKGDFKHTTPYSKTVLTRKGSPLIYYRWFYENKAARSYSSGKGYVYRDVPIATSWGGATDTAQQRSNLMNLTQSALLNKIIRGAPQWDILTDLAEGKEAVSLLSTSAKQMLYLASLVKRRDIYNIAKFFRVSTSRRGLKRLRRRIYPQRTIGGVGVDVGSSMSNLWMSYRYGFMPMIYSMKDAIDAFYKSWLEGSVLTEQVTISDSLFQSSSIEDCTATGFKFRRKMSRSCSGSIRKKAYFNYTNAMWARLIGNPLYAGLRTAWEIVPFSFVVDWFVGIGDYLDQLQVDTLVPTSSVNISEKGSERIVNWFEPNGSLDFYRHSLEKIFGASATATAFKFERSVGSLSVPGIDLSQSWYTFKRGIDSSCLLWQKVKSSLNEYVDPDTGLRYRVH